MMGAAITAFFAFVTYERWVARQGRTPLIALHLFRVPTIAFGLLASVIFFSGLAVFFVVLTVTFQAGFGYSAFSTGLLFLPFALGFTAASALSGRVATLLRGRMISAGSLLMGLSLLMLVTMIFLTRGQFLTDPRDRPLLIGLFLIYGLGQGLAQPAFIHLVTSGASVTEADAGSAAGLFLTTAQSSLALGVAAIGDVFFAWLGPAPLPLDYARALSAALICNLGLQVLTFLLVLLLPWVSRWQKRIEVPADDEIQGARISGS
jgi:predicted MFS family arabinose efflux permease